MPCTIERLEAVSTLQWVPMSSEHVLRAFWLPGVILDGFPWNPNARFLESGPTSWFLAPRMFRYNYQDHIDMILKAFLKIRSQLGDWTSTEVWHKRPDSWSNSRTNSPKLRQATNYFAPRNFSYNYHEHIDPRFQGFFKIRSHLGDRTSAKVWHKNDTIWVRNSNLAFANSSKSITARQPTIIVS